LKVPIASVSPDNARDIRLARNESFTIAEGVPTQANSWDNHDIHIREHNNYRKTVEFQRLPMQTKQMFEFHVQQHKQLRIQMLGEELQSQELAAAVANGTGFQIPAAGAAPQANGKQPIGQASAPPPAPYKPQAAPNPTGAGAKPANDVQAFRQSPQGTATYVNRFAGDLGKL
jgi:hypothetical protein